MYGEIRIGHAGAVETDGVAPSHGLDDRALIEVVALARSGDPALRVADLADQVGYSPFHFSRLFTARVGIGPGQYLTAVRIDRAKRLLLEGSAPVIDVATAIGFDSLSSFTRRFGAAVGVTPARLRQLADTVADHSPSPFRLTGEDPRSVEVTPELPTDLVRHGDPSVWIGWYPHPAPIGLPRAGVLARSRELVTLPLCAGAPWLLGFAVPAQAGVLDQLAPTDPVVAVHPSPVTSSCALTLHFGSARRGVVPLLSALPSLCRS